MNDLAHPPLFETGQRVRIIGAARLAYPHFLRDAVGTIYSVRENRGSQTRRYLVDYIPRYGRLAVRETHLEAVGTQEVGA
jgi:hypothetical protein